MENPIIINVTCPPRNLWIGRESENNYRPQTIECAEWLEKYPGATIVAYYQPYATSDPYPLVLTADGTKRIWHPTATELVKGNGELQIVLMLGDVVGTSAIIPTRVDRSLISRADHPADEAPSWTAQVVEDVTEQADRAEEASEHYPKIVNGVWYVWSVQDEDFVSTDIEAQGEDGYSPTVTVTEIDGGHKVTITDTDGDHVFDVMDGRKGDKGDKGDVGALADLDASYDETTKTLSLGTNATSLAIEDRLSATSANPVQNRIITAALNSKQDKLTAGQNITISGNTISADVDSAEIAANVTDWLDDNVTPVGSAVVVDSSLSVQGAAADAAAVGSLKSAFDDSQYFGYNLVLDNFATSSEWNAYNSTAVFGTNTVTLTATASGSNEANIRYSKKITKFVSGHKYYVSCQIKSTVRFRARIYVGNTPTDRLGYESGVWNIVDGIAAPTSNSELGFYAINHAGGVVGDVFEFKNPVLIDLTEMYGAGNEPTTVQTLRKIINGDYVDAFSGKRYQEIMGAKTAGAVIVASKDSSYVGRADYVAVGKADQVLLNELISNPSISSIYLAPDSVFSISAPTISNGSL